MNPVETKEPIDALEAAIDAIVDPNKNVEQHDRMAGLNRKIRFPQDGHESPFVSRKGREYSFEELTLGRQILQARGDYLPKSLEEAWQGQARRFYTMTTEDAGAGAELVPLEHWPYIFKDVHAASKVASLFEPYIMMDSKKIDLSEEGDAVFYKPSGEGVAVTATDLLTAKRTLEAFTIKAQVDISDELDTDAVVNQLATIRAMLVRKMAETMDELVLNADVTTGKENINYYYPTTGEDIDTASRFLIGFDGLIHYCLNEVTGQAVELGTLEVTDFGTLIAKLDKYALNPERLAFIMDIWSYVKAVQLDCFQTVDKMGSKATLLTGQLGAVYNIPVVVTGQMAKSCDTGQVHQTADNNTKGRIVLVHRDMWKIGMSWTPRVRTERSEPKGLTSIVGTFRAGMQTYGDRSDAKYSHVALGYNATV